MINFFTGRKGRVISRGYRRKGREMLYSVEISVTLRGDTAYEFLYFLFAYVFPGVDDAGIYESEFGGGKKGKAALFFSIPETMDIDFLESRSEIVGWNRPFNVSIFLSSLTDCSLFVFLLSSLKFLREEEEDEESFSCE